VSVLVRSPSETRSYFLEVSRFIIGSSVDSPCQIPRILPADFPIRPTPYSNEHPIVRMINLLRHSFVYTFGGSGIFNLIAITYAFPPRLRDRLTQGRRALPWKPWIFGERDFHPLYRLLMPCILTCMRSSTPYGIPSTHIQRSPTAHSI
jgi:hypothetical protein